MIDIHVEPSLKITTFKKDFLPKLKKTLQKILIDFDSNDRHCSLLICDNKFIQELNKQYRQKDTSTDVLSFALDDDKTNIMEGSSLGDIIVSAEMALTQANEFKVSYEEELARLTIHGLLHLLGYNHELGIEEHKEMFEIQDEYMQQFMQSYSNIDSSLI